jgi:hypothetical protein
VCILAATCGDIFRELVLALQTVNIFAAGKKRRPGLAGSVGAALYETYIVHRGAEGPAPSSAIQPRTGQSL